MNFTTADLNQQINDYLIDWIRKIRCKVDMH